MNNKLLVVILIGLSFLTNATDLQAQNNTGKEYVTIIVEGVKTPADERTIDLFIRSENGVLTSRMDYRTKKYFGVYETSSGVTIDDFKTWIINLGFTVKCSRSGIHGIGKTTQINLSECSTNTELTIPTN